MRRGPFIVSALRLEGESHAAVHLGPLVCSVELGRRSLTIRWLSLNRGPRFSSSLRLNR